MKLNVAIQMDHVSTIDIDGDSTFVLGLEAIVHFRPGYGSITRLIARSGRFGVVSVNESAHFRLP